MGTSPPKSPGLRCAGSGCGAGATNGLPADMSTMSLASPGDAKISVKAMEANVTAFMAVLVVPQLRRVRKLALLLARLLEQQ